MWNFDQSDFDNYRTELDSIEWNFLHTDNDINNLALKWTEEVLSVATRTLQNKNVLVRPNDKTWYNGYLRRLKRITLRLYKISKEESHRI